VPQLHVLAFQRKHSDGKADQGDLLSSRWVAYLMSEGIRGRHKLTHRLISYQVVNLIPYAIWTKHNVSDTQVENIPQNDQEKEDVHPALHHVSIGDHI